MDKPDNLIRINLRPVGSALPLGFFAFSIGVLLQSAFEAHWIPPTEQKLLALLVLGFVAPLELISAVFAFLSRDTAGGTTMALFAMSWIAWSLSLLVSTPLSTSHAMGFYAAGLGLSTLILGTLALAGKPFFSGILFLATARFALLAAHDFGAGPAVQHISTVLGLITIVFSFYGTVALLFEDLDQKTVLPLFRRNKAKEALEGDFSGQIRNISREPGVRQQL